MILPPPRKGSAKNAILGVFLLVFSLFNVPIFAQSVTIYGNTQVVSGQTYTYESSINARKYIWNIEGGTITSDYPLGKSISVVWTFNPTNRYSQGNVYCEAQGDDIYQAELGVNVDSPLKICGGQSYQDGGCSMYFYLCNSTTPCYSWRVEWADGTVHDFEGYSQDFFAEIQCDRAAIRQICVKRCNEADFYCNY